MIGEKKCGMRVRKLREERGLGLAELSSKTGLDENYLSALEAGEITLSIGPLLKVARALGTRLGTFLDDEIGSDVSLVRASDIEHEDAAARKARGKRRQLKFHPLGAHKTDRHMEPFFIEIYPDEPGTTRQLSSHEGEEFIVVASGQVEIVLGQEKHLLGPGDSIYFNSVAPHHVGCAGPEKAAIHAVLYFPA
jgi:transcriptional regulator with XRE-family HTH domain